jgi:hypothetical protein
LIKYIKSVLWRVAKLLSYIEDARCLKVTVFHNPKPLKLYFFVTLEVFMEVYFKIAVFLNVIPCYLLYPAC